MDKTEQSDLDRALGRIQQEAVAFEAWWDSAKDTAMKQAARAAWGEAVAWKEAQDLAAIQDALDELPNSIAGSSLDVCERIAARIKGEEAKKAEG